MRDQRIAPRDPIPQREALYILVDKPVGGGGSDAKANRFPVFLNDERLVTFAKIVGGVQDENILQMLQTAKGFRRLVHSIGVSVVSDAPDKAAVFSMYFSDDPDGKRILWCGGLSGLRVVFADVALFSQS